jgi:hypothetical protein
MMNASTPPKLTHHEINNCHDTVLSVLEHRRAQLDALRTGDEKGLSDLDQGGDVCCEDEDGNPEFAIAIENLSQAIIRLENLDARLTEILRYYCDVGPVYPDRLWQCDACRERA